MAVISTIKVELDGLLKKVGSLIEEKGDEIPARVLNTYLQIGKTANMIAKYGEPAVEDLITYAKNCRIIDHRLCIIDALGRIQSNNATEFLMGYLDSGIWIERRYAARALAYIKDPSALKKLKQVFKKISKQSTLVIIEQNLPLTAEVAHRVYAMKEGKVVAEITEKKEIQELAFEKYL